MRRSSMASTVSSMAGAPMSRARCWRRSCAGRADLSGPAEAVAVGRAPLGEPDQQQDPADHRDEYQQLPPAAPVGVVQAARRDSDRGYQGGEVEDQAERLASFDGDPELDHPEDKARDH